MAEPTTAEKAYFAGLFDGEGNISAGFWSQARNESSGITSDAAKARFRIFLTNCDRDVLGELCDLYGGKISEKNRYSENHSQGYVWFVTQEVATRFLSDVLPFLRIKRDQAIAFLMARDTYVDTRVSTPGQGGSSIDPMAARIRLLCLRAVRQANAGSSENSRLKQEW